MRLLDTKAVEQLSGGASNHRPATVSVQGELVLDNLLLLAALLDDKLSQLGRFGLSNHPADDITAAMPVFQWTAVNGAARYILHVENAAGDIVIRENNLTDVTFAAATELPADSYRVWVQAISATDRSFDIWSRALSFTINSVT